MNNLKNFLLNLNIENEIIFVDNEYLDRYCKLIESNRNTKREYYRTQLHHIIPKCYYKHYNLDIDNSSKNLVNLLYKDHALAHYYLWKCTFKWFKKASFCAFKCIVNTKKSDWDNLDYNELQELYEATFVKISKNELENYYKNHTLIETSKHFNINKYSLTKLINYYCINKYKHTYNNIKHIDYDALYDYYINQKHTQKETALKFNLTVSKLIDYKHKNNMFKKSLYNKSHNYKDLDINIIYNYYKSNTIENTLIKFNLTENQFKLLRRKFPKLKHTKLDNDLISKVLLLYKNGNNINTIKNILDISKSSIYKIIRGNINEINN